MWEPLQALEVEDEKFVVRKGKSLEPEQTPKPEPKPEPEQDYDPFFEWCDEQLFERRSENGRKNIEDYAKRIKREKENLRHVLRRDKLRTTPKKKHSYSEDALERMAQRRYNRAVEREFTLTKRQREVLQDYANGMKVKYIALKDNVQESGVMYHLKLIRERLLTKNNVHSVAVAIRKGLIT